jgi:hypothetical protein
VRNEFLEIIDLKNEKEDCLKVGEKFFGEMNVVHCR